MARSYCLGLIFPFSSKAKPETIIILKKEVRTQVVFSTASGKILKGRLRAKLKGKLVKEKHWSEYL